jgi:hypothetical protein
LDRDFTAYTILLAVFGIVGLTGTASVSPNILTLSTCNCIPSTLARVQEVSITLLAFAVILVPFALKTRGVSSSIAPAPFEVRSGRTYTAPPFKNGGYFALGVALVVMGVAVIAPSYLVLKSSVLIGEGVVIIALGLFFAYRGSRSN